MGINLQYPPFFKRNLNSIEDVMRPRPTPTAVCSSTRHGIPKALLMPVSSGHWLKVDQLVILSKYAEFYLVCSEVEKFWCPTKELFENGAVELRDARAGYMHER